MKDNKSIKKFKDLKIRLDLEENKDSSKKNNSDSEEEEENENKDSPKKINLDSEEEENENKDSPKKIKSDKEILEKNHSLRRTRADVVDEIIDTLIHESGGTLKKYKVIEILNNKVMNINFNGKDTKIKGLLLNKSKYFINENKK